MATVRVEFRSSPDVYLEYDTNANDDVTQVRGYNESDHNVGFRLTVNSGPSAGRTTGWVELVRNTQAPGTPVLTQNVPTNTANRLRLVWDSVRQRYTNFDKEFMDPWVAP